ncbi:MAG TPA: hypothetical protein VEB69_15710 [Acidimicrobiia bacterium]|nr:hypothetical protein [Acidimicrobiia bacterium]
MTRFASATKLLAPLLTLLTALAACAGQPAATTVAITQTTLSQVSTTVVPTTGAPTTTPAPDAAPPEIRGPWRAELSGFEPPMDRVFLSLNGTNYGASWGPESQGGTISVVGDTITFSMYVCEGAWTYRWVVEGDTLTFTALEPIDPCTRRVFLDGVTYVRG